MRFSLRGELKLILCTTVGVTVYTPSYILNQSEVIIMFESGVGVEVLENKGSMSTRVYLPWKLIVSLKFVIVELRNSLLSYRHVCQTGIAPIIPESDSRITRNLEFQSNR